MIKRHFQITLPDESTSTEPPLNSPARVVGNLIDAYTDAQHASLTSSVRGFVSARVGSRAVAGQSDLEPSEANERIGKAVDTYTETIGPAMSLIPASAAAATLARAVLTSVFDSDETLPATAEPVSATVVLKWESRFDVGVNVEIAPTQALWDLLLAAKNEA